MDENKKNLIRSTFILYPLRGFVIAIVPWLTHLFPFRHMKNLSEQADILGIPHFVFYLFSLLILALIYNSFILYFATYDREEMDRFFGEDNGETDSFFAERRRAFKSLPFLLELVFALLFTAFLFWGLRRYKLFHCDDSRSEGFFQSDWICRTFLFYLHSPA